MSTSGVRVRSAVRAAANTSETFPGAASSMVTARHTSPTKIMRPPTADARDTSTMRRPRPGGMDSIVARLGSASAIRRRRRAAGSGRDPSHLQGAGPSSHDASNATGAAPKLRSAPIFVSASRGPGGNAAVAKKRAMVKPMAAAKPTTSRSARRSPSGRRALASPAEFAVCGDDLRASPAPRKTGSDARSRATRTDAAPCGCRRGR
jgi:hypothetical protein